MIGCTHFHASRNAWLGGAGNNLTPKNPTTNVGLIARPEDVELDADKMDMMMSSGLQNTGKGMFD